MESEVVKAFNAELVSLYEIKPPISKKKIVDVTKAAMRAIKFYKHVVFCVEKFIIKCKADYKIPGLYCIDSIIRQSRHQFKDKDVFGPRFAVNMSATLSNLLLCRSEDKPKVVRVLNLWKSHSVFSDAQVDVWLDYCRLQHGLETDLIQVEKAVKGSEADMSIYNRLPMKKKINNEPQTPPITKTELNAHTPPPTSLQEQEQPQEMKPTVSENEDRCCCISEEETLSMLKTMGLDFGGIFTSDSQLLRNVNKIVNTKLFERHTIDANKQHGNIKSLLSKEFDYSDEEEESGDEEGNRKLQIDTKLNELTKQQIIGMAEEVLREPDTKQQIQRLHTERLSAITQSAINANANMNILQSLQHSIIQASSQHNLPLSKLPPPSSTSMPAFPQSVPTPINYMPFNNSNKQMDEHLQFNVNIDQDDRLDRHHDKYSEHDPKDREKERDRDRSRERDRDRRDERRGERSRDRDREYGDSRNYGVKGKTSSRRSKSKDKERTRFDDYNRDIASRERRERDSSYREMERHHRKMGIPWPPKPDHVLIASCTIWFGRIPVNCSEDEIRRCVIEYGEPTRVTIINSRACAYVTMKDRKSAFRLVDRLHNNTIMIAKRSVKLNWATGQGLKGDKYASYWDSVHGVSQIPYNMLPDNLESLVEGGYLDCETLPCNLIGLYDQHGLKKKEEFEQQSCSSQSHMPIPMPVAVSVPNPSTSVQAQPPSIPLNSNNNTSSLPPFPFNVSQAPPGIGTSLPFFPPGMMSLPGTFPAAPTAAIPPVSNNQSNSQSSSKMATSNNSSNQSTAKSVNNAPRLAPQQMIPSLQGIRMPPAFDSAAGMLPTNFSTPPPLRPPPFQARHQAPQSFTGNLQSQYRLPNRPSFNNRGVPRFDAAFANRQPFPVPSGMQMMNRNRMPVPVPPRFMPVPPVSVPILNPSTQLRAMHPPQLNTNTRSVDIINQAVKRQSQDDHEDMLEKKIKTEDSKNELIPIQMQFKPEPHSFDMEQHSSAVKSEVVHDDSGDDYHVTSTTHDDDNNDDERAVSSFVEVNLSEVKREHDAISKENVSHCNDLKEVTRTEDEILEKAIIYGHEEEDENTD